MLHTCSYVFSGIFFPHSPPDWGVKFFNPQPYRVDIIWGFSPRCFKHLGLGLFLPQGVLGKKKFFPQVFEKNFLPQGVWKKKNFPQGVWKKIFFPQGVFAFPQVFEKKNFFSQVLLKSPFLGPGDWKGKVFFEIGEKNQPQVFEKPWGKSPNYVRAVGLGGKNFTPKSR